MKLKPLRDKILVKPESEEETTKAGIILPDSAKEKSQRGKVVAVGSGILKDNQIVPLEVKEGDVVIYEKYGPEEFKIDGEEYLIVKEENILAIVSE